MSKPEKKTNELENSFAGCYGEIVTQEKLNQFIDFNFDMNLKAETSDKPKFAQCIWGPAGIGKTSNIKQYRKKTTLWKGKQTPWVVHDVPLAQFEEMGDLHGLPSKCLSMVSAEGQKWVAEDHVQDYREHGWKMDLNVSPRTQMAPPDWVPCHDGPSILLMDDWNRASVRIVKGIMQLLQNYGMVSWQLPKGCNIVLTGNPDQQDFLVTSLDSAILTRIKHITLKPEEKQWAQWAFQEGLDPRGVQWILSHPNYLSPQGEAKMTNPRTLAAFFEIQTLSNRLKEILKH